MTHRCLAAVLSVLLAAATGACGPGVSPPAASALPGRVIAPAAPADTGEDVASAATRARLDREIVRLSAEGESLSSVIDKICRPAEVNVQVDWQALEAAGIDRGTQVSLNVSRISARKALETLLRQVGPTVTMAMTISEGVVVISTRDVINQKYQGVRVYDVRDLLFYARSDDERQQVLADLIATVTNTVAPETWRDNGGTIGAIRELQGQLIVNQTQDNHRSLAQLLEQLRAGHRLQVSVTAYVLALPEPLEAFLASRNAPLAKRLAADTFLSDADVQLLARQVATHVLASPRLLMRDGETAEMAAVKQTPYISGYSSGNEIGQLLPQIGTVNAGVTLKVTARADTTSREVVMLLRPDMLTLDGVTRAPVVLGATAMVATAPAAATTTPAGTLPADAARGGTPVASVQMPGVTTVSQESRVRVPDGKAVILGGATMGAGPELRHVYVLVRPVIVGGH